MRSKLVVALVMLALVAFACRVAPPRPDYPPTRREEVKETLHGVEVRDPYRWLEDGGSAEVQAWSQRQDAFARRHLAGLPAREAIADRLRAMYLADSVSTPFRAGERWFYAKRRAAADRGMLCWKREEDGEEHVLLDPNTWSFGSAATLGEVCPTQDGAKVAFTVHKNDMDEGTLHVQYVATGTISARDVIEGVVPGSLVWETGGRSFYYTCLPTDPKLSAAERIGGMEIRYHMLGDDPGHDTVYVPRSGRPQEARMQLSMDPSGRWMLFRWDGGTWSFCDRKAASPRWTPLVVSRRESYRFKACEDRFFALTDEGAARRRLFMIFPEMYARPAWREIVPERGDAVLEQFFVLGGCLVLPYTKDVVNEVEIRELDGTKPRTLRLPGLGSVEIVGGREDDQRFFFTFESFTSPLALYSADVRDGEVRFERRWESPFDLSACVTEQVWFGSKDGTRVPMFVVHRAGMALHGSSPALLYGYGGFGSSVTPRFRPPVALWLEHGGVYAVANIRGGGEFGRDWYEGGTGPNKERSFEDFLAAAETLVARGFTRPERLAIRGGSNGGLLVGAATVQRPDSFRAAVCAAPLLDMVRFHRFGKGPAVVAEYGSPDVAWEFAALLAYSPYHHVVDGTRYPAFLLLSNDSDDRVDPLHARKFAAALQHASTGGSVLLRVEANAAHRGPVGVNAVIEQEADVLAFLAAETGLRIGESRSR